MKVAGVLEVLVAVGVLVASAAEPARGEQAPAPSGKEAAMTQTVYSFTLKQIDGQPVGLGVYTGQVVARFGSRDRPESPEVVQAIERALAEK